MPATLPNILCMLSDAVFAAPASDHAASSFSKNRTAAEGNTALPSRTSPPTWSPCAWVMITCVTSFGPPLRFAKRAFQRSDRQVMDRVHQYHDAVSAKKHIRHVMIRIVRIDARDLCLLRVDGRPDYGGVQILLHKRNDTEVTSPIRIS